MLSVLILTHNRPVLFDRCIRSVLDNVSGEVEILVNNDSSDITEVDGATYYYENPKHLSQVYQSLLYKANGDYVYFLEDDDYLKEDFFDVIKPLMDNDYDMISGNYYPRYNTTILKSHINGVHNSMDSFNIEHLQLSKFIFKKDMIIDFDFKNDSDIHNDELMVRYAMTKTSKVINIPNILYYQTIDGGDNISF